MSDEAIRTFITVAGTLIAAVVGWLLARLDDRARDRRAKVVAGETRLRDACQELFAAVETVGVTARSGDRRTHALAVARLMAATDMVMLVGDQELVEAGTDFTGEVLKRAVAELEGMPTSTKALADQQDRFVAEARRALGSLPIHLVDRDIATPDTKG